MPIIFGSPDFFTPPRPQNLTFKEVALDEKQPYMYRVKAMNGLGLGGDVNAAEVLYQCLNDSSPGIRGWAAQNLEYLASDLDEHKQKEITQVLSFALIQEKDIKVRKAIQKAIAFIARESKAKTEPHEILYTANSNFSFPNPGSLENSFMSKEYTNPEIAELRIILDLAKRNENNSLTPLQSILFGERLSYYSERFSQDVQYKENIKTLLGKSFDDNERKTLYKILKL